MGFITEEKLWNIIRYALSFLLLWAFFDKFLGLGFATDPTNAWIRGNSPTTGFLTHGVHGVFSPIFTSLAGNMFIDVLFMKGLFLIGMSLLLGIGLRIATISGMVLMFLLYLAVFPSENNPLIDDHIFYILLFLGLLIRSEKQVFGLSRWWRSQKLVKKHPLIW